jgi:hypothetical protein
VRFAGAIAPAGQHLADLPDSIVHRLAAEDPPGQARSLEAADAVERGEPGEQVSVSQDVGAGVGADLTRPCPPEVLTAGVDEADPVPPAPAPERSLQITAAHQHQPSRIPRVSGSPGSIVVPAQCGTGVSQRLDKPSDGSPRGGVQAGVGASRPCQQVTTQRAESRHLLPR